MINEAYTYRIHKVIDYIEKNISNNISLDDLASASNFSKFHFSRIFLGLTGETPLQMVLRLRLEKAASILIHGKEPITEIAFRCGFKSLAVFSKNFKSHFNETATSYRRKNSNLNKVKSNLDKFNESCRTYFCSETNSMKWSVKMQSYRHIEIKYIPKTTVVYLRNIGPFKENTDVFKIMFNKLFQWAGARGLLNHRDFHAAIVHHDDIHVVNKNKLRTSVCLTIPDHIKVNEEVGKMVIAPGKYVVAKFALQSTEFIKAWDWLIGNWFPNSGYQPGDGACFELYTDEPQNDIYTVELCVPVKPI